MSSGYTPIRIVKHWVLIFFNSIYFHVVGFKKKLINFDYLFKLCTDRMLKWIEDDGELDLNETRAVTDNGIKPIFLS